MMHPLKRLRRDRQLTQLDLAELAGVSTASVSRIEAGTHLYFGGWVLFRIAAALDVTVPEILDTDQCDMFGLLDRIQTKLGLDPSDPHTSLAVFDKIRELLAVAR